MKSSKNLHFWRFFHSSKFGARAQKNAILGLPEVGMSAELGLDVITRKFRHGKEVSKIWKFWCCNADIRHKSGDENLSILGFGAWSRAPPCSTGVAPSSMKMWFLKSLKKSFIRPPWFVLITFIASAVNPFPTFYFPLPTNSFACSGGADFKNFL